MSELNQFFVLSPEQIKFKNILNKKFIQIEIYAISDALPNNNGSHFTLESLQNCKETFIDKPILGFFNKEGDFESHNGNPAYDSELQQDYWDNSKGEQILGFIREKDERAIVEYKGENWIKTSAIIYTQYNYKQVKRLLKDKRKKVSVEIKILDSEEINGILYIKSFELLGITILGSKNGKAIREGIEGAHLSVLDLIDEELYNTQKKELVFAYQEYDKNNNNLNENNIPDIENNNNKGEQNMSQEFNFEELKEKYEALQKEYSECIASKNAFQSKCEEYEAKCAEYEQKCADYEAKCTEYEQKCSTYETKCAEYEQKCAEYETKCTEYEQKCMNYEAKQKETDEKYEALNNLFAEKSNELNEYKTLSFKEYAQSLAANFGLEADKITSLIEDCSNGKFANKKEIEQAFAYLLFEAKKDSLTVSQSNKEFKADLINDITHAGQANKNTGWRDMIKQNNK